MVNAWVGSTVLPDGLAGSGQIQVDLSGPFSELTVNARIDAEPLILDPIRFDRLVAETIISGSMLRIGSARFQVADGFGEVEGGMAWGPEAGDDQIDLELRGRRIPLEAVASWIGLEQWVDSGTVSFSGSLDGPVASPTGSWRLSIDDPILAGLDLGTASTTIDLGSGRFSCTDLSCDTASREICSGTSMMQRSAGPCHGRRCSLAPLGQEMQRSGRRHSRCQPRISACRLVNVQQRCFALKSELAQLDIRSEPDTVEIAATIQEALEVRADLDRADDGGLSGDGTLKVTSANGLLTLLAPEAGVPLSGTADASFTVDWKDEPLPRIEGRLETTRSRAREAGHSPSPARQIFSVPRRLCRPGIAPRCTGRRALRALGDRSRRAVAWQCLGHHGHPAAPFPVARLGTGGSRHRHRGAPRYDRRTPLRRHRRNSQGFLPAARHTDHSVAGRGHGLPVVRRGPARGHGLSVHGRPRPRQRPDSGARTTPSCSPSTEPPAAFVSKSCPDLDARLSGTWRLIGPIDDLLLSGDITVDRMSLTTKEDVASMLLGWLESGGGGSTSGGLNLALRVDAEETIELRNPFVRLTGSASLEVTGTSNSPGLVGQVELLEGGEATRARQSLRDRARQPQLLESRAPSNHSSTCRPRPGSRSIRSRSRSPAPSTTS